MNRWIFFFLLTASSAPLSASMFRAAGAVDRETILLEGGTTLHLRGIDLPPEEETAGREYLARLVTGLWVYVERGDVYRSPDALFINAEMARRPWRSATKMVYLGEAFPAPPSPRAIRMETYTAAGAHPSARSRGRVASAPRRSALPRRSRRVTTRRNVGK